jgi:membrane complex biogenesis BtpA family protein
MEPDPTRPDEVMTALFGVVKPLIGVVHFLPLPGSAAFDREAGMPPIYEAALHDVRTCQQAGVDGIVFCNEGDLPYRVEVGTEQATAAAAVIGGLRDELAVPFGVDMMWDGMATLAVAKAVGARFVREVYIGMYESDMGPLNPDPGRAFSYRHTIGADDIAVRTNLTPEFASPLGSRSVADRAQGARFFGCAAALISGPRAGRAFRFSDLEEAKAAVPDMPVLANTGVRHDTVERILEIADGVVVGTSIKVGGQTENRVDLDAATAMVQNVAAAREHHVHRREHLDRAEAATVEPQAERPVVSG